MMSTAPDNKHLKSVLSQLRLPAVIIVSIVLLVVSVFLFKRYVGDLRPALFPPFQHITAFTIGQTQPPPLSPLRLPPGFHIAIFAGDLTGPRVLAFSPGGTLLVSLPGEGKVLALPNKKDTDQATAAKAILAGLNRPHGLVFYEGKLFVAEETQVVRYDWDEATLTARQDKVLFGLPAGGNHVTRSLVFNKKGQMFVSLGSTCNVCDEKHPWLAAIITSDREGNNPRLFAKGLRNSVFLTINPQTDAVWAGDMGRDFLGDDLPPEEINIIREGKNYGWPICYGNRIHDTNFDKKTSVRNPCAGTEPPTFTYQAHAAPLGLAFINSPQFPDDWQGDLLVAFHGSWNRSTPSGYKIVRFRVKGDTIRESEDFLTGFLEESGAVGRPVDVIFDRHGSLYVSDDKAGVIYKIGTR